jgi:cysteine desulfurase/selenocysteine lyase
MQTSMTTRLNRPARANGSRTLPGGRTVADPAQVRRLFPALDQSIRGKPLVYLDSAATAQKPRPVIDAVVRFYEADNANVHRGVHTLGDRATAALEQARATVRRFLGARALEEIVFVRGATEAINLVAQTYGRRHVGPGDEVLVSEMEHHANFVPWQMLCQEQGARLRAIPVTDRGELLLDLLDDLLSPRTKLVALTHVSNALGTVNPVKTVVEAAHRRGIPVLVDGAQAVPHLVVDVRDLDCDFYAFSGHKVYGPMGIGVLYGKAALLESMPPWQCGGDMVRAVSLEATTFNDPPYRFEAGTPDVAGAVGLAAALDFLEGLGRQPVLDHEARLIDLAVRRLREIPGVRVVGEPALRAGVVSFMVDDPPTSPLDVGARLDLEGIAVRAGHHCCHPLMHRLGVSGTVRASFAVYSTAEDVERLAAAVEAVVGGSAARRKAGSAAGPALAAADYPGPSVPGVAAAAAALLDELDVLDRWDERYEFLIELGRKAPPLPAELETPANRVRGCQSTVYLAPHLRSATRDVVEFLADSDSELVRGLLALLQHLFSGQSAAEILAFDLPRFLAQVGLDANLTVGRRNGLGEMIKRLRAFAASVVDRPPDEPGTPRERQGGHARTS